jgi:hypothetical protein
MTRSKSGRRKPKSTHVWELQYEAARLERLAQNLLGGLPYKTFEKIKQPGRPLPRGPLTDGQRVELAREAQSVANRLIEITTPKKRGPKAHDERSAPMALDFRLTKKRQKNKPWMEVAGRWGVVRSDVFGVQKKCDSARTANEKKLSGWRYWAGLMVRLKRAQLRKKYPDLKGYALSKAISKALRQSG